MSDSKLDTKIDSKKLDPSSALTSGGSTPFVLIRTPSGGDATTSSDTGFDEPFVDTELILLYRHVKAVLMPDSVPAAATISLPIPPLIQLITEYAAPPFVGVVSRVAGTRKRGLTDGPAHTAQFAHPYSIIRWRKSNARVSGGDGTAFVHGFDSILIADDSNNRVRHFSPRDGTVWTLSANRGLGFPFSCAKGITFNPVNPHVLYVGESARVRVVDVSTDSVRTLAGMESSGFRDDATNGLNAKFNGIHGMTCTPDGTTLLLADWMNHRLRAVHTTSGGVGTCAGNELNGLVDGFGTASAMSFPRFLCWDRSVAAAVNSLPVTPAAPAVTTTAASVDTKWSDAAPAAKANATALTVASAAAIAAGLPPLPHLYITHADAIRRFDPNTTELSTLRLTTPVNTGVMAELINPRGIDCTLSGMLIVSCYRNNSIFAIDPRTGVVERVAGSGADTTGQTKDGPALTGAGFNCPYGVCVLDAEHAAYITEFDEHSIRKVTLPPHLFPPVQSSLHRIVNSKRIP